jgi:hypothetical protein
MSSLLLVTGSFGSRTRVHIARLFVRLLAFFRWAHEVMKLSPLFFSRKGLDVTPKRIGRRSLAPALEMRGDRGPASAQPTQ